MAQKRGDRNQEHPRASATDDIECFFSMMRDNIGLNFTTKQVKFNVKKVYGEFTKCLDPDLPLYYYTSVHLRFYFIIPIIIIALFPFRYYRGNLPSFNTTSKP